MSTPIYRFGAVVGAALGMFLLSGPIAHAWTDEEMAICAKYVHDGHPSVPLGGRASDGSLSCTSHYTDPTWTPEKEKARSEAARKAEAEWVRKGGKPDPSNGIKK